MSNVMLTQNEAEELIAMRKLFLTSASPIVLDGSFDERLALISENKQEHFILDIKQFRIDLKRLRYQNRYDETIPLVRFDSKGVHENPDGKLIKGAHIHIYKEGYGDKFAFPAKDFEHPEDVLKALTKFCEFCNVEQKKFVHQSLNSFDEEENKNEEQIY